MPAPNPDIRGSVCTPMAGNPMASGFADMVDRACSAAADRGIAVTGDLLVITAGVPFGTPGATNSLRIASVP